MTEHVMKSNQLSRLNQLILALLVMSSCNHSTVNTSQRQIDSLTKMVDSLQAIVRTQQLQQDVLTEQDTVTVNDSVTRTVEKKIDMRTSAAPPASKQEKQVNKLKSKASPTCDGCQYYVTGELSVKTDPRDESMRTLIHFYDRKGVETYLQEDVSQSYSEHTTLEFRADGSVSKATISLNPGASQYWYQHTIHFDEENYPTKKYSQRMPYDDLQSTLKKPESWDRVQKKWIQE